MAERGAPPAELVVEGLAFAHDADALRLRVPELRVAPGEALALVGPSGCGKTTFLHLLAGILLPQEGRVLVDGRASAERGPAQRRRHRLERVGLVFQELELLEHLTALENVLLPFLVEPRLGPTAGAKEAARALAQRAGIEPLLRKRPRAMSQGERQRVAICRALATAPAYVLADEPTGNLDPDTSRRVLALLLDEARRRGATLVMVTHDHGLLDAFDRVVDFRAFAGAAEAPA